jgi:phosphoribosylformimino-5-aminoimidazole carboxamide ribotide isomerase
VTIEVWPALDLVDGQVVRLQQGDFDRVTRYSRQPWTYLTERFAGLPPRLHLIDLSGADTGQYGLYHLLEKLAAHGVRVETGGGLRTLDAVALAIQSGAERVILGSRLIEDSAFRREALDRFGDSLTPGLDVHRGRLKIAGWRRVGPPAQPFWMQLVQEGFPRAMVTDVGRDGTLNGIYAPFWQDWANMPGAIGAGGGIASLQDLQTLGTMGVAFAVVGKAWLDGRIPIEAVAQC